MSSILDSLKKLEKETAQPAALPMQTRASSTVSISKRVLGIIVGLSLCIGAIGLVATYRAAPGKGPQALPPVEGSPPPGEAKASVDASAPPASSPGATEPLAAASFQGPRAGSATTTQTDTAVVSPPVQAAASGGTQTGQAAADENEPAAKKTAPPLEAQAAAGAAPKAEPAPAVAEAEEKALDSPSDAPREATRQQAEPMAIDRLEGVAMKIQAISWSNVPQKRLAVINNQVLREGDGVEGYQISRINPDDVVLSRGGKAYRLAFGSAGAN